MNVVERAMLLCDGSNITLRDLPELIAARSHDSEDARLAPGSLDAACAIPDEWLSKPLGEVRQHYLERLERGYLTGLLRATQGSIGETAHRAGIRERSLYDKMKRHGLRKEDFRPARRGPLLRVRPS